MIELQVAILVTALAVGAVRGGLGYWLRAPDEETFSAKKLLKTMARYAVFNLVTVNVMAQGGVTWTVIGVVIFTVSQLATELGFDIKRNMHP